MGFSPEISRLYRHFSCLAADLADCRLGAIAGAFIQAGLTVRTVLQGTRKIRLCGLLGSKIGTVELVHRAAGRSRAPRQVSGSDATTVWKRLPGPV